MATLVNYDIFWHRYLDHCEQQFSFWNFVDSYPLSPPTKLPRSESESNFQADDNPSSLQLCSAHLSGYKKSYKIFRIFNNVS